MPGGSWNHMKNGYKVRRNLIFFISEELKEGHSRQQAKEHLATAEAMIAKMGYHRRDNEVAELKAQLQDTRD